MIFELDKQELGEWFPFFGSTVDLVTGETSYKQPEGGAAEFRIRSMDAFFEERRKGRKREYKMVLNPQTRAMERVGYYAELSPEEDAKENDDAWDYAITGMKNAFTAPDIPMECTRENKLRLVKMPVFLRYMRRAFQILSESGVKVKEDLGKNVSTG